MSQISLTLISQLIRLGVDKYAVTKFNYYMPNNCCIAKFLLECVHCNRIHKGQLKHLISLKLLPKDMTHILLNTKYTFKEIGSEYTVPPF